MKRYLSVLLAVCFLAGLAAGCGPNKIVIIDCEQLTDDSPSQQRWLSLPDSRLVVNPYDYSQAVSVDQIEAVVNRKLPLCAGVYGHDAAVSTAGDILLVYEQDTAGAAGAAAELSTSWRPDRLDFSADYSGGLKVEGVDTFYDRDTLLRGITVTQAGRLTLAGRYDGEVSFDGSTGILTVRGETTVMSLCVSGNFSPRFYNTLENMEAGTNPADVPSGAHGYWRADLGLIEGDTDICAAVSFTEGAAPSKLRAAVGSGGLKKALRNSEKLWNTFLGKVPHPANFDITDVDSQKVTAEDVRRSYYTAWVFMEQNLLPSSASFGYSTVPAGKPSMTPGSFAAAPFASAEESLYFIRLMAYVMPDQAKEVYRGLVSLLGQAGTAKTESPPAGCVRTAYALYQITGDTQLLKDSYDRLSGVLLRGVADCGAGASDGMADAAYVQTLLWDIRYFEQITGILGRNDELQRWQDQYNDLLENYKQWFFSGNKLYQYSERSGVRRVAGNPVLLTGALSIPELEDEYKSAAVQVFGEAFDSEAKLNSLPGLRYPGMEQIAYGLIVGKNSSAATILLDTLVRDMVFAAIPAEKYEVCENAVCGAGVRPSLLGAAAVADIVLIKNGFLSREGRPLLINLFGNGTVRNLRYGEKILNMTQLNGVVTLSGTASGGGKTVSVPLNGIAAPDYTPIIGLN